MQENAFYQVLIIALLIVSYFLAFTQKTDYNTFTNNMPVNATVNVYYNNQTCSCPSSYSPYWNYYNIVPVAQKGG